MRGSASSRRRERGSGDLVSEDEKSIVVRRGTRGSLGVIIGEDEMKSGKLTLKNLENRDQIQVDQKT